VKHQHLIGQTYRHQLACVCAGRPDGESTAMKELLHIQL
jgi:hypothetical protein